MKLSVMVADSLFVPPEWDREFNHIHADSRDVASGDVFIARAGTSAHGQEFIQAAVDAGAVAVFAEGIDAFYCLGTTPVFPVADMTRYLPQWLGVRYSGHQSVTTYGVTGTNGKSSVTQFIAQLSDARGKRCGVIGTLGNGVWPNLESTRNTTPDICVVYRLLDQFANAGVQAAAIEVSSHGLHQGRVAGIKFDVAVLTNLTQDHLDYHGDMESYFAAKAQLFSQDVSESAVINIDDEYGRRLLEKADLCSRHLTLSSSSANSPDVLIDKVSHQADGMSAELFTPWGKLRIYLPMLGDFNVANVTAALTALAVTGEDFSTTANCTDSLRSVAGRMALYTRPNSARAVVDFAHTPDALERVIKSLQAVASPLTVVFGCGGDRDASKRPLMAIAASLADQVWVTDDNPRTESAEKIFNDISSVNEALDFYYIHDRSLAITQAIEKTVPSGVVLIAGKGHENYQEVMGIRNEYSDAAVLLSLGYRSAGGDHVA